MPNTRLILTFLSVAVLLVPLLLPEYLSPALVPGFDTLHHLVVSTIWFPVAVIIAVVGGALWWRASPTGQTAALFALVLLWIARTRDPVDLFSAWSSSSASPLVAFASELPVRAALAVVVLNGTAGALMQWQSTRAGFAMIGAATVAYTAATVYVANNDDRVAATESSVVSSETDSTSMASAADAPLSSSSASASSSPPSSAEDPVVLVPVKVSVTPLPSETETRQAPYATTLEEHMVQLRAPPNRATVIWNAPAYGSALGMGTRAACGSFKSDNSKVTRKMEEASGHFV